MLSSRDTVNISAGNATPVAEKTAPVQSAVTIAAPAKTVQPNNEIVKEVPPAGNENYCAAYKIVPWPHLLSVDNITFRKELKVKGVYKESHNDSFRTEKVDIKNVSLHLNEAKTSENNVILILLLAGFILLAGVKVSFGKYINQLLRAVLYYTDSYKLYRDYNTIVERVYLILNILFTMTGGLFCYHALKFFKPEIFKNNQFVILFLCFGFIIFIYLSRYVVNKVLGFILNQIATFNEYLHSTFIYYKAAGLFLLPLISVISFISENYRFPFFILGFGIILMLYLISIYKATRIMLQKGILLFYWILYLCTVEFLPVILFYKYINTIV